MARELCAAGFRGAMLWAANIPYIAAPQGYSFWWLVFAVAIVVLIVCWYTAALVWTMPVEKLRKVPVLRDITKIVLRKRFAVAVDRVAQGLAAGALTPREAHHRLARTLRTYLRFQTGRPTHVMALPEFGASELSPAVRAFALLSDGQFSIAGGADFAAVAGEVKEVITTWS